MPSKDTLWLSQTPVFQKASFRVILMICPRSSDFLRLNIHNSHSNDTLTISDNCCLPTGTTSSDQISQLSSQRHRFGEIQQFTLVPLTNSDSSSCTSKVSSWWILIILHSQAPQTSWTDSTKLHLSVSTPSPDLNSRFFNRIIIRADDVAKVQLSVKPPSWSQFSNQSWSFTRISLLAECRTDVSPTLS
jgi:hypothetical protein